MLTAEGQRLEQASGPPDEQSFFLFGPRGTGKSTLLRQAVPDAFVADLLDLGVYAELSAHPNRLEALVAPHAGATVVIDEVQRAPALLDEVHRLIERRGWRFALTGSSARKLRRGGVNLLGFSQASVLSLSNVAREVGLPRKTVEGYFALVEDLLIAMRLPVFTRRAKRAVVAHDKFCYFDCGVYRTLRPTGPLDASEDIDGPAVETLVLQELRAANDNHDLGYALHYWRTRAQHEVDVVLYGERGLVAIEVKRSTSPRDRDLADLRVFAGEYPEARCVMLYGGERSFVIDGIRVEPLAAALPRLREFLG